MASVKFPKQLMKDILFEDHPTAKIIRDTIEDQGRWETHHELIFELDGQLYSTWYSRGSTEYQDEGPWSCEDEVECTLVKAVEKVVIAYEPL